MKVRLMRVGVLCTVILATPLVTFAGGQAAKVRMLTNKQMQDTSGSTPALQQGKGAGMTRNQSSTRDNAYLSQIAEASLTINDNCQACRARAGDSAFRK